MPIDQEQMDALLEEIKRLEKKPGKVKSRESVLPAFTKVSETQTPIKKEFLLSTEKKAYFHISHHYKLTMLSIDDPGTALAIWLKGILPLLLSQHGIDTEEWERICDLGDNDSKLGEELEENWKVFFQKTVKQKRIDTKILSLINEGKKRVEKMRLEP
ncbi:MAG: hypothetical protein ACFFD4_11910 [Candidatus Odinarchaeota archaeon]